MTWKGFLPLTLSDSTNGSAALPPPRFTTPPRSFARTHLTEQLAHAASISSKRKTQDTRDIVLRNNALNTLTRTRTYTARSRHLCGRFVKIDSTAFGDKTLERTLMSIKSFNLPRCACCAACLQPVLLCRAKLSIHEMTLQYRTRPAAASEPL